MRRSAVLLILAAAGCTTDDEPFDGPLPPVVASSKYVDYSTWADAAPVCLDQRLAEWDAFIEETAAFLGVEPPGARILFVAVPLPLSTPFGEVEVLPDYDIPAGAWGCREDAWACYRYLPAEDRGIIFSKTSEQFHELVHAVDIAALGRSHPVLMEGLAQFVSLSDPFARVPEDFPTAFKEMVAAAPHPSSYALAEHFVGSLILRDGVEKFGELRAELEPDDDLDALAAAYARVYGEDLDVGLAAMTTPVEGVGLGPDSCAGENVIAWTGPGMIETTLRGECGDGSFVGFGSGFSKSYIIEVEAAGMYRIWLSGPGTMPPTGDLYGCPGLFGLGGYGSVGGSMVVQVEPGRHVLHVNFPPGPEAKGEATLKIEYMSPMGG